MITSVRIYNQQYLHIVHRNVPGYAMPSATLTSAQRTACRGSDGLTQASRHTTCLAVLPTSRTQTFLYSVEYKSMLAHSTMVLANVQTEMKRRIYVEILHTIRKCRRAYGATVLRSRASPSRFSSTTLEFD